MAIGRSGFAKPPTRFGLKAKTPGKGIGNNRPNLLVSHLALALDLCGLCGVASIRFKAASRRATVSYLE